MDRVTCNHICKCGEGFQHTIVKTSVFDYCGADLPCEKCFIQVKRETIVGKILINSGKRFRYLVPASSLARIPLAHSQYWRG